MEDVSLEDLMSALQDVQEVKATASLSERVVVELINKLQELGFLEDKLLHSVHGRDYITPAQLCKEIQEQVQSSGGRLALSDLPAQLGVDLEHCRQQADSAVAASQGSLRIVQGELMSNGYFDSVAAEVEELLQESGMISMVDLARRFKLGSELMQSVIQSHLGQDIKGQLDSGILTTDTYNERVKAQFTDLDTNLKAGFFDLSGPMDSRNAVRGALRGARLPVSLSVLVKTLQLTAAPSIQRSVQTAAEELLREGAIFGTLKAGTFVPTLYAQAQQAAAQSFYQQNFYIEYAALDKLGITDSKAYITSNFPEASCLETVAISPQLTAQLDAAVEETVLSGSWLDALSHLPTSLGTEDVVQLLEQLVGVSGKQGGGKGSTEVLAGTCLVSSTFLDGLQQRCAEYARDAAEQSLKDGKQAGATASTSAATNANGASSTATVKQALQEDSDEDWDSGRGGSKKKKAGRKRNPGKGKASAGPQQLPKASQQSHGKSATPDALSLESISTKIEEWEPETSGCGEAGNFPHVLAQKLRPSAIAEYDKAISAVFSATAEARRRKRDELAKAADELYQRLQLYAHGAESVQDDEATFTALQKHIQRSIGHAVLDLILRFIEADVLKGEDSAKPAQDAVQESSGPLKAAEKARIIKALPPDILPAVAAADKALEADDLQEVQSKLWEAGNDAGLQLKKLDKKGEKAMVQNFRLKLQDSLRKETSPAEVLATAVPILFAKVNGRATSIPGKALAGVITHLKASLQPEDANLLSDFHELVVQSLRSESNSLSNDKLIALIPSIRTISGVSSEQQEESTSV